MSQASLSRAGLALGIASLLDGCRAQPPRFTNLVVVVVDTLRSDHLPTYGYARDTAPVLRRLASEGVQLQGYATSSWTKPSVASLFSGLLPQRHQTISLNDRLPDQAPYLPALLAEHGFTTLAFVGNAANLGRKQGFRRGFTVSKQWMGPPKIHAGGVNRRTLEILPQARAPYFLWVHYVDTHDPYKPPSPWPIGSPATGYVQPGWFGPDARPSAAQLQRMRDQYDGEIVEVDQAIGELLEELRRRQLLDGTLVVVTSDHGEEFGEHGWLLHGHSLHEELLRVPFVVWAERGLRPLRSAAVFSQVDFLPTALDALGIEAPRGLDGSSRWAAIASGRPPEAGPLLFHLDRLEGSALALFEPPLKLIERWGEPDELLYDLSADPGETASLPSADRRVREMRRRLFAAHRRTSTAALPRAGRHVDAELKQQLAALGYLRGGSGEQALAGRRIPALLDPGRGLGVQTAPPQ
jgi:arylsulfatase A-like enzyme